MKIAKRLDELANLSQGWYDGEQGEIIPKDSIIKFKKLFLDKELLYTLSKPFIYPTIDGGLSIEWDFQKFHATLDVDMKTFEAKLLYYSADDKLDDEKTVEYNLKLQKDWSLLELQVLKLLK